MKLVDGWYCPDYDNCMDGVIGGPRFCGRYTYQFYAIANSLPWIVNFHHALDIGAHIGLFSHVLSRMFDHVTAYEPVPSHAECFRANIKAENVRLQVVALGDKVGRVNMALKQPWSVKARVHTNEALPTVDVPIRLLDSCNHDIVDFVKIDCEGYEIHVLNGGEKLIRRNKPTILVEQKPGNTQRYHPDNKVAAVDLLRSWGARVYWEFGDDYCMGWSTHQITPCQLSWYRDKSKD